MPKVSTSRVEFEVVRVLRHVVVATVQAKVGGVVVGEVEVRTGLYARGPGTAYSRVTGDKAAMVRILMEADLADVVWAAGHVPALPAPRTNEKPAARKTVLGTSGIERAMKAHRDPKLRPKPRTRR